MGRLHGTWEATGGGGAGCGPVVVAVVLAVLAVGSGAAAAVEAAATLILAIVVAVAAVSVAGLVAGMVLLRRYSQRGAEQLAHQAEAMRASQPVRQVAAPAPQTIVNHFHGGTHIHAAVPLVIAEDGRTIQALPVPRNAITTTEGKFTDESY
jgi:hypothetical protein